MSSIIENSKGVSFIEALLLAAVLSFASIAMVDTTILITKKRRQNNIMTGALNLESEFLGALANADNFREAILRAKMNDGVTLPPIPLLTYAGAELISLPPSPRSLNSFEPSIRYYNPDLVPCEEFDQNQCVLKLEASLILVSGPVDDRAPEGEPEWYTGTNLANETRVPVYHVAYRVSIDSDVYALKPRGVRHSDLLTYADHLWPIPTSHYVPLQRTTRCSPQGVVIGMDPDTKEPICLEPKDMCGSKTSLAKQLKIDKGTIGIECANWSEVKCPDDYVPSAIYPAFFDSDFDGKRAQKPKEGDLGVCIYFGEDSGSESSTHHSIAQLECSLKYNMSAQSCEFINETTSPCIDSASGASVPANKGSIEITKTKFGFRCEKVLPSQVCPIGTSGGSWDASVRASATCTLDPNEREKPLEAQ